MRGEVPVTLGRDELELIERLVRRDRTALSSALLSIAVSAERAASSGLAALSTLTFDRRVRTTCSAKRFEARLTGMSAEASPVLVEVLRFEDLPLGSLASRRAVVRWSDGSEGQGLRWYSDEVLVCEAEIWWATPASSSGPCTSAGIVTGFSPEDLTRDRLEVR